MSSDELRRAQAKDSSGDYCERYGALATEFGISVPRISQLVHSAGGGRRVMDDVPTDMRALYRTLVSKVGRATARQVIADHMRIRGI
jgi:hypothetical protein